MSRAQAAMIPASLCISQLLTYFLGNLKAFFFFHSALEITKDSLNSMGSLSHLPCLAACGCSRTSWHVFSRLVDKTSKYFEVKKASFCIHLIFSTAAILNLSLSFSCCCHTDCKNREVGPGDRGDEIKIKIFFFSPPPSAPSCPS